MKLKQLSVAVIFSMLMPIASANDVVPFVVGGEPIQPPSSENWMVSLRLTPKQNMHFCGGSIIDAHWVLTAAHCVVHSRDSGYFVLQPNQLNVMAGTWDNSVTDFENLYSVTHVVVHPDYSPDAKIQQQTVPGDSTTVELKSIALDNDVALIRVERAFSNTNAASIKLAAPEEADEIDNRLGNEWQEHHRPENTTVFGWGAIDTAAQVSTSQLLSTSLSYIPMPDCFKRLELGSEINAIIDSPVNRTKICTLPPKIISTEGSGLVYGPDSCKGDSGGPLTAQNNNGEWVQIGIVSGGPVGELVCGSLTRPSFYSRVGTYFNWIESYKGTIPASTVIEPSIITESRANKCRTGVDGVAHTNCNMVEGNGGSASRAGLLLLSLIGFLRRNLFK